MKISKNNLMNRVISILLTVFATFSSLIVYLLPSSALRGGLALLLFCVIVIAIIYGKTIRMYAILPGLMLLIYLHSNYNLANKSLAGFVMFINALLICVLACNNIGWAKKALAYISYIIIFYSICTIVFKFTPDFYQNTVVNLFPDTKISLIKTYRNGYIAGLTNHYSTNAMLIASGLMIELSKLLGSKKRSKWNYPVILLHTVALLLTGKRGQTVFLFLALLMTIYLHYSDKNIFKRLALFLGTAVLIVFGGYIAIRMFPDLGVFIKRFQNEIGENDISNGRYLYWALALSLFADNPIIGIGWGQFQAQSLSVLNYKAHAHNVFLQLLCETGLIGFVIYVSWFAFALFVAVKAYRYSINHHLDDCSRLLSYSVMIQLFFLLYCLTGNPLYDAEMYVPYFIGCSIGLYYYVQIYRRNAAKCKEKKH